MLGKLKMLLSRKKVEPVQQPLVESSYLMVDAIYNPLAWLEDTKIWRTYPMTRKNPLVKKLLEKTGIHKLVGSQLIFFEYRNTNKKKLEYILRRGEVETKIFINSSYRNWGSEDNASIKGCISMKRLMDYIAEINFSGVESEQDKEFNSICRQIFAYQSTSPHNRIEDAYYKYFQVVDNNGYIVMLGATIDSILLSETYTGINDAYDFVFTIMCKKTHWVSEIMDIGDDIVIGHIKYENLIAWRKEIEENGGEIRYINNIFKFVGTLLD